MKFLWFLYEGCLLTKIVLKTPRFQFSKNVEEDIIHILHVDDNAGILLTTKQILELNDRFHVESADSVEEALKKMKERSFDVVVSDYQMPEKDGLSFLAHLRNHGNHVPFILFTGKGRQEVAVNALNLGADYYVNKSGNPETVYGELIHHIIQASTKSKTSKQLQESENLYHILFSKAPLGISIIDFNGTAIEFNDVAHRQLGYSKEEFAKLTVSDYEVLESPDEVKARMKKILKSGKDEFESKHCTKNGEIRDIINTVQLIELNENKFFQVITRDITEQKKAERKLEATQREKNAILDGMSELVIHQDLKHRILWANRQAAISVGINVEQFKDRFCYEIWGKRSEPCVGCPVEATFKTGQLKKAELSTPDGKVWSITGFPIKDKTGNICSVVEVAAEITEQKKVEKALRDREKTYRELLNGMKDTAWVVDFDCNIIDVNKAAVERLGYSRKELLSMDIQDIDVNLNPKDIKALAKNMPKDQIQVFPTEHTTKDRKRIPVEICSSIVEYYGKNAILSIARDITERKKVADSLKKTMQDLININEKLGVVGKLTRHDARNKLSIIANNVYLAKIQLGEKNKTLQHLSNIDLAISQIDDIFSFARSYEMLGSEELSYQDVTKCFDEAAAILDSNNVQLINNCKNLSVFADSLLRQVFYNLIDNSLKYGETLTNIRLHYKIDEKSLRLIYEDNGSGILNKEKEKIFQHGYGRNTGLGLYMIEKICKCYGWKIRETGTEGRGAQFTITIPKGKYVLY